MDRQVVSGGCHGILHHMGELSRAERNRERRATVERYHQLKDAEEEFAKAKKATDSPDEHRRLLQEFAAFRRRHREEDVERGKRAPGFGVLTHQIMWARWIEVAAEHVNDAETCFEAICAGDTSQLVEELRQSLVAIAAAASTVEAVYEDVRYLIPELDRQDTAPKRIADCLCAVFGICGPAAVDLKDDLEWLFHRRNEAVHPYAEPEAPRPHPSGLNTSAEASQFNAAESRTAFEIALAVLKHAEAPPKPANQWVERWRRERSEYHEQVVAPIRSKSN